MSFKILLGIFIVGLLVRFLYFPQNVYFAYDQARDSYTALDILKGDFKIVGPPSAASDKLFAGPLIFYILAPIYWLGNHNPEVVSGFFRVFNALGVFPVFLIGRILFNKFVGFTSAFLFAISYEQSQYSLFISHQPLAVVPVLLLWLGLAMLFFRKEGRGLFLVATGWGLALQFHYVYLLLFFGIFFLVFLLRKNLPIIKTKDLFGSLAIFFLIVGSYILSEIKFNFRITKALFLSSASPNFHPKSIIYVLNRFLHDTFWSDYSFTFIPAVLLIFVCLKLYRDRDRQKLFFLLIWLFVGTLSYFLSGTPSYYYSAGASVSLILLSSYLLGNIYKKSAALATLCIGGIIFNNLFLISSINPKGLNSDMVIQPGMLLSSQKEALDYIYKNAGDEHFSVNSLTIPYNINTTWNYLFEWYGKKKYSRLPIWVGPVAHGYPGSIPVSDRRSDLPNLQFLIIEPTVGIDSYIKHKFFNEENYFSRIEEEKSFGTITVQKRQKI
ncbi:MAG: glycosyltransferase family 39 protein [Patescibacteria group bacterium]